MKQISHKFLTNDQRYKKSRLNQDGTTPIYLRIGFDRSYRFINTGLRVKPDQWDHKKQRVKKHPHAITLNVVISKLDAKIGQYKLNRAVNPSYTDLDAIESYLLGKGSSEDAHAFMEEQISAHPGKINTIKKHRILLSYIKEYSPDLPFSKINYSFVKNFQTWLLDQDNSIHKEKGLSQNYINTLLRCFRYYTNEARRHGLLDIDPFLGFKIKSTASKTPHLTLPEIMQIEATDVSNRGGDTPESKDVFLFACYTGLRFSDLFNLKVGDFKKTQDGLVMVVEPIKTKDRTDTTVQINVSVAFSGQPHSIVLPYLESKNPHDYVFGPKNYKTHNSSFNKHLKVIQDAAGIDKSIKLTAHVARHTCAMLLLNELGWSIDKVKTYLGHADISTTQRYAKATYRTVNDLFV